MKSTIFIKTLILTLMTFLSSQCYSQTFNSSIEWNNGRYSGDVTIRSFKRVPHGSGTHEDYEGNKYVGKWSEGKKNGKGVYYFASGNKVVGTWVKGLLQGNAKFYFASGSVYDYVYKDNKAIKKTKISSGKSIASTKKPSQQRRTIKNNNTVSDSHSTTSSTTSSPPKSQYQQIQQPIRQRIERYQVPCSNYECQGGTIFCMHCAGDGYDDYGRCNLCNNGRKICPFCRGLGFIWQERMVNY